MMINPLAEAYQAFLDIISSMPSALQAFYGFVIFCFLLPLVINSLRGSK